MKVKIKLAPGAKMPTRATNGSVGYDLYANVFANVNIEPGNRLLVPTGVYLELPPPHRAKRSRRNRPAGVWMGIEAQIRPRSGLALRHGVTVLNTPGTIDSDYRGELGVLLVNLGHDTFLISGGDRVGQVLFNYVYLPTLDLVEDLEGTPRGGGGFGSTGV